MSFCFTSSPQRLRARQVNYNKGIDTLQHVKKKDALEGFSEVNSSEKSLLGNNAKSFDHISIENGESKGLEAKSTGTLLDYIDETTGEVIPFKINSFGDAVEDVSIDKVITERYLLQSAARYLMPTSRVAKCTRLSCGSDIGILKNLEYKKTAFTGLQTCGSVWGCTVCGSKIAERRKLEVVKALDSHLSNSGQLYFLTFTFSHTKSDSLQDLRFKQSQALKFLRQSKSYRKYKEMVGYVGFIRALEVTWGASNGWHPHTHEILFCENKVSFQSIKRILFPAWVSACEKAGLPKPSYRRGLDVRGGDKAGAYVTKYGNELTKSHTKKARGDRFTPFDLLRSYFYEDVKLHGARFVEFAEGMQGSRQLYWTNGLKDLFSINEKTDDEIAKESQEHSILLGNIPFEKWKAVMKYDSRSTILIMAKDHGFIEVENFVNNLYLTYCLSGNKKIDDDKIKLNAENRKSKIKPVHQNPLEKRTFSFERLNDEISFNNEFSSQPQDYSLNTFVFDLKYKLDKKEEKREFIKNNYMRPKD